MATKKKTEPVEAEIVSEERVTYTETRAGGAGLFWGLVLIALGVVFLTEAYTDINLWQFFWPGVLIFFGLSLVFRSFSGRR